MKKTKGKWTLKTLANKRALPEMAFAAKPNDLNLIIWDINGRKEQNSDLHTYIKIDNIMHVLFWFLICIKISEINIKLSLSGEFLKTGILSHEMHWQTGIFVYHKCRTQVSSLMLPMILKNLAWNETESFLRLLGWMGMDSVTADTKFIRTWKIMDLKLLKNTLAGTAETKSFPWLNTLKLTNQINLQNIQACTWLPDS